jgi:hypothetical protein
MALVMCSSEKNEPILLLDTRPGLECSIISNVSILGHDINLKALPIM